MPATGVLIPRSEVRVLGSISEVPAEAWDALTAHEPVAASPFVRHAFLEALERSGAAGPRAGWRPRHLVLFRAGRLVAAAPAWLKDGSEGDFSRDWEWAAAAARAGLPFYPKLSITVPATPVTGRRLLVAPGEDRPALVPRLVEAAQALAAAEGAGGVHVLFPLAEEAAELEAAGLARRLDFQYHWQNAGYADLEAFLARFPSKRRTAIRRELRAPAEQGIAIRTVRGDELGRDPAGWGRACFELHRAATDRMTWGMRWVNRSFYERVIAGMPDAVEVVEARRDGRRVAMAFNLASPGVLYGRYWGNVEDHPFLHFNVALYHSIAECIGRGVARFEGGAGGEHKLARGFEPAETWSCHALADPRLDAAVRQHLAEERRERGEGIAAWRADHPRLGG
ncbi:MAG TPA: GNAT family N-acetyltransferase [Anaeromyxobacteraceae bacterium]|nr:GNAT family N-acetyltransferase [Anaeromyxobacteraceae bacterium]